MLKIETYTLKNPCKISLYVDNATINKNITKLIIYEPTMAHLKNINYSFVGYIKDTKQENGFNQATVELFNTIRSGGLSPQLLEMFIKITDFMKVDLKTRHAISDAEHTSAILSLLTTKATINNDNDTEEETTLLFSPETASYLTAEDLKNLSMLDMQNILKIVDNFFFNLAEQIGL